MTTELTDEQLGRAWCERNGKRPAKGRKHGRFCWTTNEFGNSGAIVELLVNPGDDCGFWSRGYESESAAYAAVGAALRKVVSLADEVLEIIGGEPQ